MWWLYLHLDPPVLVAGFFGSIVKVFSPPRASPGEAVGYVIVGTLTANYLNDFLATTFLAGRPAGMTVAFVVGFIGTPILQLLGSWLTGRISGNQQGK